MPNLTDQRLADREALMKGLQEAGKNRRPVTRSDIANRALDIKRQNADLAAQREQDRVAIAAAKAQQEADNAKAIADQRQQRIDILRDHLEFQKQQAEAENKLKEAQREAEKAVETARIAKMEAEAALTTLKANDETLLANQVTRLADGLSKLSRDDPKFTEKFWALQSQNPLAAKQPEMAKKLEYEQKHFDNQADLKSRAEIARAANLPVSKIVADGVTYGGDPIIDRDKELHHYESLRMRPNLNEDQMKYLDGKITALKTPAPVAPVVPASTPTPVVAKPPTESLIRTTAPLPSAPAITPSKPTESVDIATPPETVVADSTTAPAVPRPAAPAELKPMDEEVAKSARAAIASGKDEGAVRKRLQESGYDHSSL